MGHYYDKDGNPHHFVKDAKGNERDTTLRDARKHGWYPSVTEIQGIAAQPGLEAWKQRQVIEAALTLPRLEGESVDEFMKRIPQDAFKAASEARDRGTEIHNALEHLFKGESLGGDYDVAEIAHAAFEIILEFLPEAIYEAEITFAHEHGFGGMVDLCSQDVVADYKTKDITDKQWNDYKAGKNPRLAYPSHCEQLSAYDVGLGFPGRRLINFFIDRNIPGRVIIHEWEKDMYDRFECLLDYWQKTKDYYPMEHETNTDMPT